MKFKKSKSLVFVLTLFIMITAFAGLVNVKTSTTPQDFYYGYGDLSNHTNYCIDAYMMFGTKIG